MKHLILFLLLSLSVKAFSQTQISFELGGNALRNFTDISYSDKTYSYGGHVGINVEIPVFKEKLFLGTGLYLYNLYYRAYGDKIKVSYGSLHSSINMRTKINNYGVELPLRVIVKTGKFYPFIGMDLGYILSSNQTVNVNLFDSGLGDLYIKGEDIIELTSFIYNICGGFYYSVTNTVKLKLEYALGLNDFVSHTFDDMIVNYVSSGTYTETTKMQQLQIAVAYSPDWDKLKEKRNTHKLKEKRNIRKPFNERIKAWYQ